MQNSPLNMNHELPMHRRLQHHDAHRRKTKEIKHKNKRPWSRQYYPPHRILGGMPRRKLFCGDYYFSAPYFAWVCHPHRRWSTLSSPSLARSLARSLADDDGSSAEQSARRRKLTSKNEIPIHPSIHPLNHPSIHIRILPSVACCRWPQCEQGLGYPTNFSFQIFF